MSRVLFVVIFTVFVAACARTPSVDYGQTPIKELGTFPCFNNQLLVKVSHGSAGKLSYSIENARVGVVSATPSINESADWMMFPESPGLVWIYDGANDITLVELYADGGTKFTSNQVVPDIISRAPKRFFEHLPATMTQKADSKTAL